MKFRRLQNDPLFRLKETFKEKGASDESEATFAEEGISKPYGAEMLYARGENIFPTKPKKIVTEACIWASLFRFTNYDFKDGYDCRLNTDTPRYQEAKRLCVPYPRFSFSRITHTSRVTTMNGSDAKRTFSSISVGDTTVRDKREEFGQGQGRGGSGFVVLT